LGGFSQLEEWRGTVGKLKWRTKMLRRTLMKAAIATTAAAVAGSALAQGEATAAKVESGYLPVSGLQMYYESHGEGGVPLILIHGAFSATGTSFGRVLPGLAKSRRVISLEMQAHGHTADIDRPLSYPDMADDVAAALDLLGIAEADVYGYSMGAAVALHLALRHPGKLRKLVLMSIAYRSDGIQPGLMEGLGEMQPSMMYGSSFHEEYLSIAPRPEDFDRLFAKKTEMDRTTVDLSDESIKSIAQPVLLIAGDSDLPTLEHMVSFFRLLGGGFFGDTPAGLPKSQLAILPGASHIGVSFKGDLLLSMIPAFLDG
jgi:pimeloyl-ACP methyl ester carboxylesterase